MAPAIPSTALMPTEPVFTNTERLALAGFLAGYSGLTRQAYELDLRQFSGCATGTSCICSRQSLPGSALRPGMRWFPCWPSTGCACEATGANIPGPGIERGHRTLVITRKLPTADG